MDNSQPVLSRSRSSTPEPPNPHLPPSFCLSNVRHTQSPILYLPPFLSSPPEPIDIGQSPEQTPFRPVVTETRLPEIDPASLSLHKALHRFRPLTLGYANTPYEEAFNWSELSLPRNDEREWYCVVFRSKRRSGSDSEGESFGFNVASSFFRLFDILKKRFMRQTRRLMKRRYKQEG